MVDLKRMYLALGNDLELQCEILREYLRAADDVFTRLKHSFASQNEAQTRVLIHKMRGMAANIYASEVESALNEIETHLNEGGKIPDLLKNDFIRVHGNAIEFVRQFLAERHP